MKKKFLTVALLPLTSYMLLCQSFQPTVIGSAGTFATSASGSMSWTIGEVSTETYSSASNFFTQGFHQPESIPISVNEISSSQNISIYPNPVASNLNIDFSGVSGSYSLYIYDMLGQLLRKENISASQRQLTIPFSNYADGIYLLNIINTESNTRNSYKINKAE